MSIVGPGALTEYGSGPRRGGRRRGTVYVDEPATGFFIAGSSLKGLNGIYIRKNPRTVVFSRHTKIALAYENCEDESAWSMVLASTTPLENDFMDPQYEWQFLDPITRKPILRHEGETLIPGSGLRWEHCRDEEETISPGRFYDSDNSEFDDSPKEDRLIQQNCKSKEELEDELPWQVIALLDASITRDLLYTKKYRDEKVARSQRGDDLPQLNPSGPLALARQDADKEEVEFYWLYVVIADSVEIGSWRVASRGDYLKITRADDTFLYTTQGEAVLASACSKVKIAPVAKPGPELDDENEDLFDKPFEPRLQDSDDIEIDEDDNDDNEIVPDSPRNQVEDQAWYGDAQSGRAKGLIQGAEAWLIRAGCPAKKCQILGLASIKDELVPVLLESKQVLVESRCLQLTKHETQAAILGVDVQDEENFTEMGLLAAFRAADRDAAFERRLYVGSKYQTHTTLLIDAYNHLRDKVFPCNKVKDNSYKNPLEAIAAGSAGKRASSAALRLVTKVDSCQDEKRALNTLKQIMSDESSRKMRYGTDLCRLQLAIALAGLGARCVEEIHARRALELNPQNAAANVVLALYHFRRGQRDEAASLLKKALDLGPGTDSRWAYATAASLLRKISRTQRYKNKADDAYRRGNLAAANDQYSQAIAEIGESTPDTWLLATLFANRSACLRRLRKLSEALIDVDKALALFPAYTKAIFRKAVLLFECGKPKAAKRWFLELLRLQRNWPQLSQWLTRCIALYKRKSSKKQRYQDWDDSADDSSDDEGVHRMPPSPNTSTDEDPKSRAQTLEDISNPDIKIDYYSILGVDADASSAQLKRAYRISSLRYHPDKKNGSTIAFQRVAEAFEVLNNPDKRREYDLGDDLNRKKNDEFTDDDSDDQRERSLHEEVERKYFPERYEFYPFGDPFVEKRKLRARRAKERNNDHPNW
eukprot:CAMPEP_0197315700 /NCGR_PEP_ID=MMETSP0891-20130614/39480_1 /TAXON_ID=44058 ORGANISM="Aureoumbra lagunensis, Strain CCMP1510" /NCGR_SAMPLE_ID=MMETSP0891 /ASSEMBLY_ACC=CAM_ASM_000534 /LENGTH=933 /DNA_ID=CAMNT_0042804819 /DNA_START=92 /DNA_END=2890 /DNA_ORIENTATION=+